MTYNVGKRIKGVQGYRTHQSSTQSATAAVVFDDHEIQ